MFLSAGPIAPPLRDVSSGKGQRLQSAVPVDAQANTEVETKRSPEDTSPAQQHPQMVQFQPIELSEQETIFSRSRKTNNNI